MTTDNLGAVVSLLTEDELRQELKAGHEFLTHGRLLRALRKIVLERETTPEGFEPGIVSFPEEPYFKVETSYSRHWTHPKVDISFVDKEPPAWPLLAKGYCTASNDFVSITYVVDAKKQIWTGTKSLVYRSPLDPVYFLEGHSFQDTSVFGIFGREAPRPDWMEEALDAGWVPPKGSAVDIRSDILSRVESRLSDVRKILGASEMADFASVAKRTVDTRDRLTEQMSQLRQVLCAPDSQETPLEAAKRLVAERDLLASQSTKRSTP